MNTSADLLVRGRFDREISRRKFETLPVRFVRYSLWIYSDLREDDRDLAHNSIAETERCIDRWNAKDILRWFHGLSAVHPPFRVIDFRTKSRWMGPR